jgi:hypothetical protein
MINKVHCMYSYFSRKFYSPRRSNCIFFAMLNICGIFKQCTGHVRHAWLMVIHKQIRTWRNRRPFFSSFPRSSSTLPPPLQPSVADSSQVGLVVVLMVLRWTGDWSYLCIIERGICVTLAFSLRYQQTPAHLTRVIEYIPYTYIHGLKKDTTRRRTS